MEAEQHLQYQFQQFVGSDNEKRNLAQPGNRTTCAKFSRDCGPGVSILTPSSLLYLDQGQDLQCAEDANNLVFKNIKSADIKNDFYGTTNDNSSFKSTTISPRQTTPNTQMKREMNSLIAKLQ